MSENKVSKTCFTVNFMVKPLEFFEGDRFNIEGLITAFTEVCQEFGPLK